MVLILFLIVILILLLILIFVFFLLLKISVWAISVVAIVSSLKFIRQPKIDGILARHDVMRTIPNSVSPALTRGRHRLKLHP